MINLSPANAIPREHIDKLREWLDDEPQLTMGDMTRTFEEKWCEKFGFKHAVFCNSGSSANLLMLYAAKLHYDIKHVFLPALCWATDLAPALQLGLDVTIIDCDMNNNLSLDTNDLYRQMCKKRELKSALLHVSILGLVPPHFDEMVKRCQTENILLLEDNCESLGSQRNGVYLGHFGEMSTFSTYYSHHITSIEGGFICTNNSELHKLLLMLRSHGWSRDLEDHEQKVLMTKHGIDPYNNKFTFYVPGFNVRPTEIQSFLGLLALTNQYDQCVSRRAQNLAQYVKHSENGWVPHLDPDDINSSFGLPYVQSNNRRSRQSILNELDINGIQHRPLIAGDISQHPMCPPQFQRQLKTARYIHEHSFYLPNHQEMDRQDIFEIIEVLK